MTITNPNGNNHEYEVDIYLFGKTHTLTFLLKKV